MNRRDLIQAAVAGALTASPAARAMVGLLGGAVSDVVQYNSVVIGQMPDYYISPTANPANDGTTNTGSISAPWSINALNTQRSIYAGKVVGLMNGTYGLYTILGLPGSGFNSGGNLLGVRPASTTSTFTNPTIIVSQTPLGAIIDGQSAAIHAADPTLDWGEGLLGPNTYDTGSYGAGLIIDGIKFQGGNYRYITNYGGAYPSGRGGTGNNGCDNLTVRNCYFTDLAYITAGSGTNTSAVYSDGSYHVYVQNCRFDTITAPSNSYRQACIQFFSPTIDTIVENCTCIGPPSGGNLVFWKCGPNIGHQQAIARFNYLDGSQATSACVPIATDGCNVTSDTFSIYNNIILSGAGAAWMFVDNTGADYQGTFNIHDNTLAGNWSTQGGISSSDNWTYKPVGMNFYNNILAPSSGGGSAGDIQVPAISEILTWNYNLYPPASVSFGVGNFSTYSTLSAWKSATSTAGFPADTSSAQGNPLFVGTGTDAAYYELGTGSPALTMSSTGGQIGAWNGASSIGSGF